MAVTGNEMKMMKSYSQTKMLMNVVFFSPEICFFYVVVEVAFVLEETFFEEMAAFLGLVVF